MRSEFRWGDQEERVELQAISGDNAAPGKIRAVLREDGRDWEVTQCGDGQWILQLEGHRARARVVQDGDAIWVHVDGLGDFRLEHGRRPSSRRRSSAAGDAGLCAAMTSQVVQVFVSVGDEVQVGDPLVALEAMKMESRIAAPFAGTVASVHCKAGEVVDAGVPLIKLEPSADEDAADR